MICPNVNAPNFICRAPVDPLHQRVFTYLQLGSSGLTDSVSTAGSLWGRSITVSMTLTQSDYWIETVSSALGVTDSGATSTDRPGVATDALGISDSFVYAGTAGDGAGGGGIPTVPAIFDSNTKKGMVVYVPSSGHADLAKADAAATARAVGLATANVVALATGDYTTEGVIEQADWTFVTGSATLTPGAYYYLSESAAGQLTTTAPTTTSQYVVAVGRALSTTQLDVEIAQPILL